MTECERWRETSSRRRQWKRQLTCVTPLKRLPWFADTLVETLGGFHEALVVVDVVTMGVPAALTNLRRASGECRSLPEAPGHLISTGTDELAAVLEAVLSGWIDFRLLLSPPSHAVAADHDERTTFFSTSAGKVAGFRERLREGRVEFVEAEVEEP